ncbi:MAG: methyltransferase domain-containing protein [Bacteroidota bacterium]
MFTKEYWNKRAQTYGHTGHAEPFYYCFDQQARLYAVNEVLESLPITKNTVLDFGCGAGDFIDILKPHFEKIYAFDISEVVVAYAKQRFDQPNIVISSDYNELIYDPALDLILTVTVLQSLTKEDLESIVKTLNASLSETGVLLCMEFFREADIRGNENELKATTNEWKNILAQNKLKIIREINFYNPVTQPTKSWYSYNTNLYLKIIKLFKKSGFAQAKFTEVAKKLIKKHKDVLLEKQSAFKIYHIQKENSCN